MPSIVFLPPYGPPVQAESSGNEHLIDICDDALAPVPFACRSTTCGTCAVVVEQGEHLIEPPSPREAALQRTCQKNGQRFACALRIRPGNGVIRLRICGNDGT